MMGFGIKIGWPQNTISMLPAGLHERLCCMNIYGRRTGIPRDRDRCPPHQGSRMIRPLAASEAIQWIVYAVGALTIVYVVMRPSFRKKDPLANSGPKLGLAQQRSVEREMSNLLVEL